MNSKALAILLAVAPLFSGCASGPVFVAQFAENESISLDLSDHIHSMNEVVITGIKNNDASEIHGLFLGESRSQPEFSGRLTSFVEQGFAELGEAEFAIFHEVHGKWSQANPNVVRAMVAETDSGIILHANGVRKQMYYSLIDASIGERIFIVGLLYVLDGGDWKLYDLRMGPRAVRGQDAFQWAESARQMLNEGLVLPAHLRFSVANLMVRPIPQMQYVKEDEIRRLGEETTRALAGLPQLPLVLEAVATQPKIYSITFMIVAEDLTPIVHYITELELDEVRLEREVSSIAPVLEQKFPGLCATHDLAIYKAYNDEPADPARQYRNFGVIYDCRTGAPRSG